MKVYATVIYDISSNKKRVKIAKLLKGYGFRIQKSAFEVNLDKPVFAKMQKSLKQFEGNGDSIRIYRIIGKSNIIVYDSNKELITNGNIII